MHLAAINIADELIPLWRGLFKCDATDDKDNWDWAVLKGAVWKDHGRAVAAATKYLPGSFDRPPRNPAEKINSGYKAWEYLLYLFGLGPVLLYGILPEKYWIHFCKLVRGIRLMQQHNIRSEELVEAHTMLTEFELDFELEYYQRRTDRMHFMRPWLHGLIHLAPETITKGPPICSSQWTMERTIGNLGQEIRSHSQPYANLSQRGVRRAQVNALKVLIPALDPPDNLLPRGAIDLGGGFVLLNRKERTPNVMRQCEVAATLAYIQTQGIIIPAEMCPKITRWARLRLPNGQIARSAWKEQSMTRQPRMSRNVKMRLNGFQAFGEVYFYFQIQLNQELKTLALVSMYSPPDMAILKASSQTLYSCVHRGDGDLVLVEANTIESVVAMIPHKLPGSAEDRFFLVEKPGLDVVRMGGAGEDGMQGDDDDEAN
ncbi:hypothetical protein BJ138DRAFT_1138795 [Hygrophoropsis aurantiaca]|uniref:Uncharacterized protein n=1 Tax=Hygrophoropsis aurantiaca TaxID=72124 RepID=A0ACB7ZQV2_9AGAM|nr:hypothetical protein BJ138DRAFT_1138795 [Hygrophoropsis aurantiaca]